MQPDPLGLITLLSPLSYLHSRRDPLFFGQRDSLGIPKNQLSHGVRQTVEHYAYGENVFIRSAAMEELLSPDRLSEALRANVL